MWRVNSYKKWVGLCLSQRETRTTCGWPSPPPFKTEQNKAKWAFKATLNESKDIRLTWYRTCLQCMKCKRCRFNPWVRKIPWRREWQPTPVFFSGESHAQRSLVGYNPRGHKELWPLHTTEGTKPPQPRHKTAECSQLYACQAELHDRHKHRHVRVSEPP